MYLICDFCSDIHVYVMVRVVSFIVLLLLTILFQIHAFNFDELVTE